MQKKYNIAFLGAGNVAEKVVVSLSVLNERLNKYSVASRSYDRALAFKEKHHFYKVCNNYIDLVNDPDVDIVYVSTPTGCHYEHIKLCLQHHKHVITEKPITVNSKNARELIELSKQNQVLLIDGIWTMYMPMYKCIDELVNKGKIGEIKRVYASFGYPGLSNPRLTNPNGGGALLDKGIYCIALANHYLKNRVKQVKGKRTIKNKVDIHNEIVVEYFSDTKPIKAHLHCSIKRRTSYLFCLIGSKGMIVSRRFWAGNSFFLLTKPFHIKKYTFHHDVNGYEYEFRELLELLDSNEMESKTLTHDDSVMNMTMIDTIVNNI